MDPSQRLRFIVVGQDSLGLVHSIVINDIRIDSSNNNDVIYEEAIMDNWEIITDAQGNVLSGPEDYVLVQ
ncbi:hypothetical protein JR334_10185 [Clostridia bacterium]|nr:hypothetical protein JR334_10185 [Clostridia bacterium]